MSLGYSSDIRQTTFSGHWLNNCTPFIKRNWSPKPAGLSITHAPLLYRFPQIAKSSKIHLRDAALATRAIAHANLKITSFRYFCRVVFESGQSGGGSRAGGSSDGSIENGMYHSSRILPCTISEERR